MPNIVGKCKEHYNIIETRLFDCKRCGFTSDLRITLKLHLKHVHKAQKITSSVAYRCEICGKMFNTKKEQCTHVKNHNVHLSK